MERGTWSLAPLEHEPRHFGEVLQQRLHLGIVSGLHINVAGLSLAIDTCPAWGQRAALHAVCQPSKLRVLVQNGYTGIFSDWKIEDFVQQLEGVTLNLKHLATLPVEARIGRATYTTNTSAGRRAGRCRR